MVSGVSCAIDSTAVCVRCPVVRAAVTLENKDICETALFHLLVSSLTGERLRIWDSNKGFQCTRAAAQDTDLEAVLMSVRSPYLVYSSTTHNNGAVFPRYAAVFRPYYQCHMHL